MAEKLDMCDLYGKPVSYKFNAKEIAFIKKNTPKKNYKIKYAIYNKTSSKNLYIAFIIDQMPYSPRRSAIENNWDIIAEREISNLEYHEMIQNYGTNHRRFKVWYYRNVETLMQDDLRYNVTTPDVFVKKCKNLGYSGSVQLEMKL